MPRRLSLSAGSAARFACASSSDAMRQGMVTVNVEPTPILLSTSTVPPISPTSFFTMPIPMPLPSTLLTVDVRSRSNGSKIRCWNSCDMPMPLSATVTTVSHQPAFSQGFCVTSQRIVPPVPVYLTALLTRFVQTSVRCGISA